MDEMSQKKLCVICDRWFANGKALGGHMRAHFAKLPIPPKPNPEPPPEPNHDDVVGETEPDLMSEEEGAVSLMMLSRDSWTRVGGEAPAVLVEYQSRNGVVEQEGNGGSFREEEEIIACNDVIEEEQLIGSGGGDDVAAGEYDDNLVNVVVADDDGVEMPVRCECSFCEMVFGSTRSKLNNNASNNNKMMIDLNRLPEPEDDDEQTSDMSSDEY